MTDSYRFQEYHIRPDMIEALDRYVQQGMSPGGFLQAVLENKLVDAALHADRWNLPNLPAYAAYLYNELPSQCWGSPEKVTAWLERGGLSGVKDAHLSDR